MMESTISSSYNIYTVSHSRTRNSSHVYLVMRKLLENFDNVCYRVFHKVRTTMTIHASNTVWTSVTLIWIQRLKAIRSELQRFGFRPVPPFSSLTEHFEFSLPHIPSSSLCIRPLYVTVHNPSYRSSLWYSGQRSWLQTQRSRVLFQALPDFLSSSRSRTGSTQPREDNWGATWKQSSGSDLKNREYRRGSAGLTTRQPSICKSWY
jgi:hypothetical protein